MCEIINPFFSTVDPFFAWIWAENQEEAPKIFGSVYFPSMKQTPEFTRTVVLNISFNISSVFPRDALFHSKGFTRLRYSVSGKRDSHVGCLRYKHMEGWGSSSYPAQFKTIQNPSDTRGQEHSPHTESPAFALNTNPI